MGNPDVRPPEFEPTRAEAPEAPDASGARALEAASADMSGQAVAAMSGTAAAGMPESDPHLDGALRALADANRRAILQAVRARPVSVGELAGELGLSQQTTSHHLGVLRDAGLATRRREGTRHLYVIETDGIAAVRAYLDDFWPSKLVALKTAVEADADATSGGATDA